MEDCCATVVSSARASVRKRSTRCSASRNSNPLAEDVIMKDTYVKPNTNASAHNAAYQPRDPCCASCRASGCTNPKRSCGLVIVSENEWDIRCCFCLVDLIWKSDSLRDPSSAAMGSALLSKLERRPPQDDGDAVG